MDLQTARDVTFVHVTTIWLPFLDMIGNPTRQQVVAAKTDRNDEKRTEKTDPDDDESFDKFFTNL